MHPFLTFRASLMGLGIPFHRSNLQDLASNRYWDEAVLPPLPWHQMAGNPGIGAPQLSLHKVILEAIAPAMPLKAVFSGTRR